MSFKWSREQTEKLIICIEQKPCIYSVKSPEYLDRVKKFQAFNFILEELKKFDKNMTVSEIKRKWKVLRTQYTQEMRALADSEKSGAGSGDAYVPKLWCFQQLQFLRMHSQNRERKDNTTVTIDNIEDSTSSISEENLTEEPPKKIRKISDEVNGLRSELENFKTLLNQRKTEKKYTWLGKLVANQMEMINPEDQLDAAWEVQCLLRRLIAQSDKKNKKNTPFYSILFKNNPENSF